MPEGKKPTATFVSRAPSSIRWMVNFPSTVRKPGKSYFATTYDRSELIYITTAATGKVVSKVQGRKMHALIKAAIEEAKAADLHLRQEA